MPDPLHTPALEQQRDRIRSQLASIGDLRPGPLREKFMRCGKPTCHCHSHNDPGHGPYFLLDCQTAGRNTTRSIPAERVEQTRAQVEECKRLRRLTNELIEVSEQLCDTRSAEAATDKSKKTLGAAFVADIQAEVEALLGRCPDGALDLETVETAARRCALQVAALAVQQRINADGSDWQGPYLPCDCGQPARYAGRRAKTFLTALGPVELHRAYYHCAACKQGFFPRDRSLGLAGSSLSPATTRMVGTAAACPCPRSRT